MMHKLLIAAAALSVLASAALAKDVNKASIQELESGGLQGGIGCLYVYTDVGLFTLPLNQSPNTPQIVAAMNMMTPTIVTYTVIVFFLTFWVLSVKKELRQIKAQMNV